MKADVAEEETELWCRPCIASNYLGAPWKNYYLWVFTSYWNGQIFRLCFTCCWTKLYQKGNSLERTQEHLERPRTLKELTVWGHLLTTLPVPRWQVLPWWRWRSGRKGGGELCDVTNKTISCLPQASTQVLSSSQSIVSKINNFL